MRERLGLGHWQSSWLAGHLVAVDEWSDQRPDNGERGDGQDEIERYLWPRCIGIQIKEERPGESDSEEHLPQLKQVALA